MSTPSNITNSSDDINWLKQSAENGDKDAMNNLALHYLNGEEIEKNLEKAFYWYQKAAENGFNEAMCNLALCYYEGFGTKKNLEKAFYWNQKAAENGFNEAICNLALCYHEGFGTEKNLEKAFYWYKKAAENDDEIAMYNLAICYENGEGIEKNLEQAFRWYKNAAENDNETAMYNLAICYENGEGTEENSEQAFYWYQKAAENGEEEAIYNLAMCYYDGFGTEKNLEKAFYWNKKAAENGDINSMNSLAIHYENGEGTEKNLEKAFYWFQKAAENDNENAMHNLAIHYENGKGTEKDLEKAFYLYQKAAEKGIKEAIYNLAVFHENGDGTEKNLEKAFYLYQKAAENGVKEALYNLAICYKKGDGTEKNLEKGFNWYQKAAENGNELAMNDLALCYKNGEGTKKNLEKAFYWYQKAKENSNTTSSNNNELCKECKQSCIDYNWCQECNIERFQQNFSKWTSKNEFIDKFIQEAQLNAKNNYEVLEWIPYGQLKNIKYYDKGGFSEIYKAIWLDGPIDNWNFNKQQWNRRNSQIGYEVILKILNNSSSLNDEFLNKWKCHYNCQKKSFSKFIQFFGITQDPNTLNYIIIISYAKEGNLRNYLPNLVKFKWQHKLQLLKNIILGIKIIHESNIAHCDLHDGNILISDNYETYIIDLGLCKPISDLQDSINRNYGVLPYMAPEVLRNESYTLSSDIYSFSMIMWEFTSGIPPFNRRAHDYQLGLGIREGERPEIIENTPKCYIELMKKCWDSDSEKRPNITDIEIVISQWLKCVNEYYELNNDKNENTLEVSDIDDQSRNDMYEFIRANETLTQEQIDTSIIQFHPQAYYTSRLLTEILDQKTLKV
ncbi:hypothetical protein C1645_880160 [Glomus cerebriforme]|uniref:Protein kinase domain-containing protein n=1 Tax=Glomus cerebriforme TaxID=658196 RepID=A0A397SDH7_9GLOM|nr:hypothetical protein C1645_880160 [Glomus cerebriforme]